MYYVTDSKLIWDRQLSSLLSETGAAVCIKTLKCRHRFLEY